MHKERVTPRDLAALEARLDASIQKNLREQTRFFFLAWSVILAFVVGLYAG